MTIKRLAKFSFVLLICGNAICGYSLDQICQSVKKHCHAPAVAMMGNTHQLEHLKAWPATYEHRLGQSGGI